MLRSQGVRENVNLTFTSPVPFPFANKKVADVFTGVCADKGVKYIPNYVLEKIEHNKSSPEQSKYVLTYKDQEEPLHADIILGPKIQKAHDYLIESGLTNEKVMFRQTH
eukprot:UN30071